MAIPLRKGYLFWVNEGNQLRESLPLHNINSHSKPYCRPSVEMMIQGFSPCSQPTGDFLGKGPNSFVRVSVVTNPGRLSKGLSMVYGGFLILGLQPVTLVLPGC